MAKLLSSYSLGHLTQNTRQELYRDKISQVYFGKISDEGTQQRARRRIDWIVENCEGDSVFDIGCSEGVTAIMVGKRGLRTDAIDIHPDVIKYAENLAVEMSTSPGFVMPNFRVCDIFSLDRIEPDYDTVILGEVIEHVYEPGHMVQRASFALKTGGRLIVTTPWGHFPAPDHHQTFYLSNFIGLLPPELQIESLAVVDGYIRLLARKNYDPRDSDIKPRSLPADVPGAGALLSITEMAALDSQQFLRSELDKRVQKLQDSWKVAEKWKAASQAEKNKRIEAEGLLAKSVPTVSTQAAKAKQRLHTALRLAREYKNTLRSNMIEHDQLQNDLNRRVSKLSSIANSIHAINISLHQEGYDQSERIKQLSATVDDIENKLTYSKNDADASRKIIIELRDCINNLTSENDLLRSTASEVVLERDALRSETTILKLNASSRATIYRHLKFKLRQRLKAALQQCAPMLRTGYRIPIVKSATRALLPAKTLTRLRSIIISAPPLPGGVPSRTGGSAADARRQSISPPDVQVESGGKMASAPDLPDLAEAMLGEAIGAVVICNSYPGKRGIYGGEFIRTRLKGYASAGLKVSVIELHNRNKAPVTEVVDGLSVLRAPLSFEDGILAALKDKSFPVLIHSPSPELQDKLPKIVNPNRLMYWFHGFELIDYRKFHFNYSTSELETLREYLDSVNDDRFNAARITFADERITKIFVSEYLQRTAENHVGISPNNFHVVHNYIDTEFYRPAKRPDSLFSKALLLRPFSKRKYGTDIAINAILMLSRRPGFSDMHFTIVGWGENFIESTAPLTGFENIEIIERYNSPEQMRDLYEQHGVFLCPTRHDTQGVSFCEAMSSGMACVTNNVSAIPEFADDTTALLVPPDDIHAYAEAIYWAMSNASSSRRMGLLASSRMRKQCGFEATLLREIRLIEGD